MGFMSTQRIGVFRHGSCGPFGYSDLLPLRSANKGQKPAVTKEDKGIPSGFARNPKPYRPQYLPEGYTAECFGTATIGLITPSAKLKFAHPERVNITNAAMPAARCVRSASIFAVWIKAGKLYSWQAYTVTNSGGPRNGLLIIRHHSILRP